MEATSGEIIAIVPKSAGNKMRDKTMTETICVANFTACAAPPRDPRL